MPCTEYHQTKGRGVKRALTLVAVLLLPWLLGGCESAAPLVATPPPKVSPELQTNYQYALSLMKSGQDRQAQAALERIARQEPRLAGPHVNLGILHMRAGRWEKAEAALQKAIELNPANAAAWNHLGIVLRHAGKFEEALAAYQKALSIRDDYAIAHLNIGILYDIYFQKLDEALEHYRRYQSLTGESDTQVAKWIVDLERRAAKPENG